LETNSPNPFPESEEKKWLRRRHLSYFTDYREDVGHDLAYLGLPAAEMLDVILWRDVLSHITAIERDPELIRIMYRTARLRDIRRKSLIVHGDLARVMRVLAAPDTEFSSLMAPFPFHEQERVRKARRIDYDIINMDLCGGFLYRSAGPDGAEESTNVKVIQNLIAMQSRRGLRFLLILTLALRDNGKQDYLGFIREYLSLLPPSEAKMSVEHYYTADKYKDQPPQLRRYRFCIPIFLLKEAFNYYHVRCEGAWSYKTFYHGLFLFDPKAPISRLGSVYPPEKETQALLTAPLFRLKNVEGSVVPTLCPAPTLI